MKKTKIALASNNKKKIKELQQILGNEFEILTLNDLGCTDEIEETGITFQENSEIKAKYIYQKYNINVIADDSGLEVEALDNRPGVYSARYAGIPSNDKLNIEKILAELKDIENRNARFKTVITLILNGETHFFEGKIEGKIIEECRGENGFGYDPIFVPNGYEKTFAELDAATKNSMSHRGKALQMLLEFIKKAS